MTFEKKINGTTRIEKGMITYFKLLIVSDRFLYLAAQIKEGDVNKRISNSYNLH